MSDLRVFWLRRLKEPRYHYTLGQRVQIVEPVEGFIRTASGRSQPLPACSLSFALSEGRRLLGSDDQPMWREPRFGKRHKRRPRPGQLSMEMPVQMTVDDCIREVERERGARAAA